MKKLVLILMGLLFSYISFAQNEKSTSTMSNYEKYALAKEKAVIQDTIYKTDTVFAEQEKKEWDDLYYTPSKDQLKNKAKDLRLRKREIRIEEDSLYYDAKEEVYSDLSFTANIYRFHRPYYGFGYYNYYWDSFYDPWFSDSWYYGGYPYYGYGFGYPYYNSWGFGFGYNNWYGGGYPYYQNYGHNNHYGNNYYNNNYSGYNNHNSQYEKRVRPSSSSSTESRRQPVTINRTVQIDRSTGRTLSVTNENRRVATSNLQKSQTQSQERRVTTNRASSNTQAKTQNRSYTPSYENPRLGTRPLYNNTNTSKGSNNYTPTERRTVIPSQSTQSRNTPKTSINRSSAPSRSYSAPSRSYSAPSRSNSTPSRSSSGSSYSAPSRSSSGSSYSAPSRSSSNSGSSRSSSGSSSGRR